MVTGRRQRQASLFSNRDTTFPTSPSPSYPPPNYGTPPASPYLGQPSPSYQYEYQRGGSAGCVYGCTGE
jgi:hypothetical protein